MDLRSACANTKWSVGPYEGVCFTPLTSTTAMISYVIDIMHTENTWNAFVTGLFSCRLQCYMTRRSRNLWVREQSMWFESSHTLSASTWLLQNGDLLSTWKQHTTAHACSSSITTGCNNSDYRTHSGSGHGCTASTSWYATPFRLQDCACVEYLTTLLSFSFKFHCKQLQLRH